MLSNLGRRLGCSSLAGVPVSAVMLTRLETVTPGQSLEDVAQLFVGGRISGLPLLDHGTPIGVVTRDDVATGLARMGPHASIAEAPRHEVIVVTPSDLLAEVLEQLRASPEAVAIVVDQGTPVGLLTFDALAAYAERARAA